MADTVKPVLCAMCDDHSTKVCGGCKAICYCSKSCQKNDWPVHRLICKDYANFLLTRPDPNHHSALYFPVDEAQPRFVWLRYAPCYNQPAAESLVQLGSIEEQIEDSEPITLSGNNVLGRHIEPHHIIMSIPEVKKLCPCCTPGLKSNQSLLKVDTELGKFYRGPVLAWGGYCGKDDEKKASTLDLGPMDFRHLVDELRLGYSFNEEATRTLMHSKDIYAVRLNCEGDQRFLQRPTMEAVYEQSLVLFTESQVRTPVADRIGIPLIVYKAKPAPVWRDRNLHARMKNHKARMLNPPEQSADTGSLILVRKDGKPLHPTHVHALISYTAVKLVDPTRSPDACITADILHADRVDQVSREDFEHWYHDAWQKYPLHSRFVPSPFDIQEDFHDPAPSISFQI